MGYPITDDRIDREFRRHQLVRRLLAHQARTRTICELTRLSRHQLVTLRERWRVTQDMRYRGPSPKSFVAFLSPARSRSEGAALAALCRILGAVPAHDSAKGGAGHLSMEIGERLCDVYEAYGACFPQSDLSFDRLLLLARGLAQGDVIAFEHCAQCECSILVDRLGNGRLLCSYCQRRAAAIPVRPPDDPREDQSNRTTSEGPEGQQQELF